MKIIKTDVNGNVLLQEGNRLYIYPDWNLNENVSSADMENDWRCDAIIEMLPNHKIIVHQLKQLYQFNHSMELLNHIKLIAYGLEINGIHHSLTDDVLSSPQTYQPQGITEKSFSLINDDNCPSATFQLKLHGKEIIGKGTFIKYWFFDNIEEAVSSIIDLMSLYVAITKLIARASFEQKDTYYMHCDDWIVNQHQTNGHYTYSIKKEFLKENNRENNTIG